MLKSIIDKLKTMELIGGIQKSNFFFIKKSFLKMILDNGS